MTAFKIPKSRGQHRAKPGDPAYRQVKHIVDRVKVERNSTDHTTVIPAITAPDPLLGAMPMPGIVDLTVFLDQLAEYDHTTALDPTFVRQNCHECEVVGMTTCVRITVDERQEEACVDCASPLLVKLARATTGTLLVEFASRPVVTL